MIYIYIYTSLLYKKGFSSVEMNTDVHLIWKQDRIDININWSKSDVYIRLYFPWILLLMKLDSKGLSSISPQKQYEGQRFDMFEKSPYFHLTT